MFYHYKHVLINDSSDIRIVYWLKSYSIHYKNVSICFQK